MLFSGHPTMATSRNSNTNSTTSIGICAATLFAGALLFYNNTRHHRNIIIKHNKDEKKNDDTTTLIAHQLAKVDAMLYMIDLPPITTLTWFQGDFRTARPQLEKRMRKIIAKNPWIQGQISVSSYFKGTCHLSYRKTQGGASVNNNEDINIKENLNVINPVESPLSRDMPIGTQNNTLVRSKIYTSDISIQNGPKEALFKATLVPCSKNPHETFALIVQLSHVVGDGATYYKLMHMLCSSTGNNTEEEEDPIIVELIPERIEQSAELQIAAMGKAMAGHTLGFICRNILGMIMNQWKGPLLFDYGVVDSTKMEEFKASSAKEAGLPFVSTNDVLTSWLMKHSDSPHGMMLINWRNRLEGHTNLHAGNYSGFIYYEEDDYASPGLIRQSLDSCKRIVTRDKQFPSWWGFATTKCTCISNWMTFAKPNMIEGCVEDVHFPLVLADALPTHRFRVFIIFRAGIGKIGLCYPPGAMSAVANDPFGLTKKSK